MKKQRDPLKLLLFCPYYPPHMGGLESHAAEFNHFVTQSNAVPTTITVYTPHFPATAPKREMSADGRVTIIRFPAIEVVTNFPLPNFWDRETRQLLREAFTTRYDLVLSRTRFFLTSIVALIYSKVTKTPWVHIEHGSDFVRLSSPFKTLVARIYDYTFGWLVFNLSTKTVAISKAVARFVMRFNQRPLPIIYRGLDFTELDKIKPNDELRKNYKDKILIAFVGRLYSWKGVANSITAVKSLPKEWQEKIVFLIAGDGEDYAALKKMAEEPVVLLGAQTREAAVALLKSVDIYIHSAYPGGGLSTSLLEAMYSGCATIATPHEGADEVVTKSNGILLSDSNADEIREALLKLLEDRSLREKLGNAASETVRSQFNWPASVKEYEEIFTALCK